jgi:murein DD-endopeptidase MepM/ murein hydrolase activator NlpD
LLVAVPSAICYTRAKAGAVVGGLRRGDPNLQAADPSATLPRFVGRPLVLLALALALAPSAHARPDGPLEPYLDHLDHLTLAWPADGTVTDGFGWRWGRVHTGVDIGILRSLDVTAAADGLVAAVGELAGFEGYGTVVLVDDGESWSTLYAHLARADVAPGEWVVAGQPLGLAGCTGSCTGTHLHFELRRGGVPVDPLPLLEASG